MKELVKLSGVAKSFGAVRAVDALDLALDGDPTTVDRIRAMKDCDICINITSSGSVGFGDEERIYPLTQLLPELASYDCGTMNWLHRTVFENHPRFLEKLGLALQ